MTPQTLPDDTALKLAQAETSRNAEELQAAYEKLFWLCYRNHLDPSVVFHEAETYQTAEVA